jgi:hypothetical protein
VEPPAISTAHETDPRAVAFRPLRRAPSSHGHIIAKEYPQNEEDMRKVVARPDQRTSVRSTAR